jgi:hypothetical protein
MIQKTATPLVCIVVLIGVFFWCQSYLKRGKQVTLRKVPAIDALDEAIERCTEMARPVHYCFGVGVLDADVLASLQVLTHVAKRCAELDCELIVSNALPEVQPMVEEIVRTAFRNVGKDDAYKPDNIRYLTSKGLTYAVAILGIIGREKPAANFMLGPWGGEFLVVAEGGRRAGAIQIAGTSRTGQLPFVIAASDYALIGDELFAASVYLSKQPTEIANILLLDLSKLVVICFMLVGVTLSTLGSQWLTKLLQK